MAQERVVRVTLTAQMQNYIDGMEKARKVTHETASEASKLADTKAAFDQLGRTALTTGALLSAGLGIAVARMAEFDAAMSNVAATGDDAASNIDALREAALEAGASTVFSATESANAIEELAKAGVSAADILNGGLAGALDLAAAGQLEVADAAGIAATQMKVFNLEGGDMAHVADLLAAGAGKAMGDVQDLSEALNQSGQVAAATGLSIDETAAALAAFASQGLLGSDAGTSFKTMLQSLTPQSQKAKDEMERLGISAYDAQGQFVGLEQFAGNLQTAMKDLTPEARNAAMSVIFGSDAVRAANVLYKEGESGIRDWISAVDDQGFAARTAATRLDNLKGDIEALQGAIDTAFIETGTAANDSLRVLVQTLTGLVDLYNDLPEPVQGATLAVGGATAAVALAGGAALLAVPKYAELKAAMQATGTTAKGLSLSAGAAGLALGGLFAIVGTLAQRHAEASAGAAELADTLDQMTGAATENTRAMIAKKLADRDAFEGARNAGISQKELTDAIYEGGDAVESLRQKLYDYANANPFDASIANSVNALNDLSGQLAGAQDRHDDLQAATDESAEVAQSAADAYMAEAVQVQDLDSQLRDLIDTINEANGVGQDAISANLAYQDALAQVDAMIAEGTTGWAANTQAGRDNQGMLVDLAKQAQDAAEAQFNLDGNTDAYRQTLEGSRQALIDRAMQLGATADEASALADQIFRIPSDTEWELIAHTAAAQATIDRFIWTNDGRRVNLIVDGVAGRQVHGTDVIARAYGGAVYGSGPSTVDSVPAMLAPAENEQTAEEVVLEGESSGRWALAGSARWAVAR